MIMPFRFHQPTQQEMYKAALNVRMRKAKHLAERMKLFISDIDKSKMKEVDKEKIKHILMNFTEK